MQKTKKNIFFVGILKATGESSGSGSSEKIKTGPK
jgi:hypothetical protein